MWASVVASLGVVCCSISLLKRHRWRHCCHLVDKLIKVFNAQTEHAGLHRVRENQYASIQCLCTIVKIKFTSHAVDVNFCTMFGQTVIVTNAWVKFNFLFPSRWHLKGCRGFSYWCFPNSATFPSSEEYKPKAHALGWEATGWVKWAKTSGKEHLISKRLFDQWLLFYINALMSNIKPLHNVTTPAAWRLWWLQETRSQRESVEMRLRACFCVCDSERVCVLLSAWLQALSAVSFE